MMNLIRTTDNNGRGEPFDVALHLKNLQHLSDKPLCELDLDEHPNLLIFPPDFKTHGDDIGKQRIFTIEENCLVTGNIMGFIGYRNTQVSIRSRFTKNDSHDYFLHYMLQRVFAINFFDLKFGTDNEGVFDFLIYLFPAFLKRAIRQGIYKEYHTRNYNDSNVKGKIDIARHIRQNIPFTGKIAYTTREYSNDNHVTQLIRHTIDYIAGHPFNGNILYNDEETRNAVSRICQATPTYNHNELRHIVNLNLYPVRHPYFNEYFNLQRLCMQILRHEEIKYGYNESYQIYGILYDGAWLWEEYLNTVLRDIGFRHPKNRTGEGGKRIFADKIGYEKAMPDYHREDIVLDAKYKHYFDWNNISRDDRNQLLAYMYLYETENGGFIVPVANPNIKITRNLNGHSGKMSIIGMNVGVLCNNFREFCSHMVKEEEKLKEIIELIRRQAI